MLPIEDWKNTETGLVGLFVFHVLVFVYFYAKASILFSQYPVRFILHLSVVNVFSSLSFAVFSGFRTERESGQEKHFHKVPGLYYNTTIQAYT